MIGTADFNLMKWLQILIFVVVVFFAWKALRKFNLLGESKDTQDAKALATDAAMADVVTNMAKDPNNPFLVAIKNKFGTKPTKAQLDSLLPNKPNYPSLQTQILNAHNNWSTNDASKIFGVYKQLSSQYEINFFNTVVALVLKSDVYGMLDKLMFNSDMATLRAIINSKPLI